MSSQFENWIEQAKESLSVAGPICKEANDLLSTAQGQIEKASVLWAQTVYLHTMISGQIQMLSSVIKSSETMDRNKIDLFDVSMIINFFFLFFFCQLHLLTPWFEEITWFVG